jgi:hypothetical protein
MNICNLITLSNQGIVCSNELTRHLFLQGLLLDAATACGEDGQSSYCNSQGGLLIARNSSCHHDAASLDLGVENGATIVLAPQSEAAKGKKTGCARLAAALSIKAADTCLKMGSILRHGMV